MIFLATGRIPAVAVILALFGVDTVHLYIIVSMNQDDRPGLGQDEPGSDE